MIDPVVIEHPVIDPVVIEHPVIEPVVIEHPVSEPSESVDKPEEIGFTVTQQTVNG